MSPDCDRAAGDGQGPPVAATGKVPAGMAGASAGRRNRNGTGMAPSAARILKLTSALLVAAVVGATGGTALAASCPALQAELQRVSAGTAQSAEYRKWDAAARSQNKALGLAERDFRHLGCAASSAGSCDGLGDKIKRMRANLAKIERQRDRHATPGAASRKAQLRAALRRQGCGETRQASAAAPGVRASSRSGGGFLALFGIGAGSEPEAQDIALRQETDGRSSARVRASEPVFTTRRPSGPTYRTMCVRTCDGFYFPVSFSTSEDGFGRDAAICRSMCPAAEAQLFVHRNPGETVENLVSVDGMPYTDLPNANRFRTAYVDGCGCQSAASDRKTMASLIRSGDDEALTYLRDGQPAAGLGVDALREGVTPEGVAAQAAADRGHDPDTLMNMELGFAPVRAAPGLPVLGGRKPADTAAQASAPLPADAPPAENVPAEERNVRIVGPRYFVAQ